MGGELKLSAAEEQEKWLADALNVVKQQAFFMKRALDSGNLREALKYSAQMLSELRTSKLSPHKYYELYMGVFSELQHLESFFWDEHKLRGRSCVDLYELVQHAGNIVPRLYLLCSVGSVYIRSKEGPAKEVLSDLGEVCKGVQHPIRGLFLRAYLTQCSRDKLPDTGSEYEGDGGTVDDAIEFLLQNFTEMNKLWVRMQHQGPANEKEKREKERKELRDLVGKNLHLLSQLEGVTLDIYKTTVLPRILEQVVNCRDEIAQFYLMDCLIQVFPDEFHLNTLETLLGACPELQLSVDVKTIMSQLMDRLSNYADKNADALPQFLEVEAFAKFNSAVAKIMDAQPDMPLLGVVSLHSALLQFVLRVHADRLDHVDAVLAACVRILDSRRATKDSPTTKQLVALLNAPLDKFGSRGVATVLRLPHYGRLMEHLDHETNKGVAVTIIQSMVKHETTIGDSEKASLLLHLVRHLMEDVEGVPPTDELDLDDFAEEQHLVARLVHMLRNDDPETMFQILTAIRSHLFKGGQSRLKFTMPSLVFCSLQLIHNLLLLQGLPPPTDGATTAAAAAAAAASAGGIPEGPLTPLTVFLFLHKVVESLSEYVPALALKLALECAQVSSSCGLEPIAYDLFTLAFVIYEEEISDSKAQVTALHLIIGTLQRCHVFADENRDTLTHKATGYSAKLLKKADQCRAVCACAHLFWSEEEMGPRDGERVVLCLKRALKIANAAAQQLSAAARVPGSHVVLLVEILNKYLYFFDKGNPHVTPVVLQGLVELINSELSTDGAAVDATVHAFYRSTLAHIRDQKHKSGATGEKYAEIQI